MTFNWLKQYMPRGLYGRAALILILPVVVLQLVVSVIFIQRHFEDVTTQMTRTVVRELALVLDRADGADTPASAVSALAPVADPLALQTQFVAEDAIPRRDFIRWYDFSGRVMMRVLRTALPQTGAILLPDNRNVIIFAQTRHGWIEIGFDRLSVSASNPHQLLVNMVFFGGLMTVIAFFYLRNQLRPITRLASAAQAFGRGRSVPYHPSGATEVRVAGHAFLDMRARIERQIEQRTLMLSGVSHDLRTPLTRLKLGLSLVDEDDARPMLKDVSEMERLLEEFLNFAKGAAEGEPELTDPVELVRQLVADGERAGTAVSLADVSGAGEVPLRSGAIRRALDNLVNNAVRYGSRAEISVTISEKSVRFRVEDDGPGIPSDQRAEAVKPFARLDPARNQNKGTGVGLGLAIAADIARAHGGVLRLGESARLGGLQADIVIAR